MGCTLCEQETFGLGHSFDAVSKDYIDTAQGILEGVCWQQEQLEWQGDPLQEGQQARLAMAGAVVVQLPAGGTAGSPSTVSAVQPLGALVASTMCFAGLSSLSLLFFAQGSIVVVATAGIVGLSLCRAFIDGVEVATLVAGERCLGHQYGWKMLRRSLQ